MTCPECHGPQLVDHPAGELAIQHTIDCTMLRAEDATQAADHERGNTERPATDTERQLLAHLGHDLPNNLATTVERVTRSIVRRRWPQLDVGGEPTPHSPQPRRGLSL